MSNTIVLYCLFICFLFPGCSGNGYKIADADRIEIIYSDRTRGVLKYTDTSKSHIEDFKKVLDRKVEKRKCPVFGEFRFYQRDSVLFEAGFVTGGNSECQFLMAGEKAWRLICNTGMFLNETFNDLKRK